MIKIPATIETNEDKVRFLCRVIELLRLEHNEWGKSFREGKLTEKEFRNYQNGEFHQKISKISLILNPIKESLGMFQLDPRFNPSILPDDSRLLLEEQGKQETKWDSKIDLTQI